MEVIIAILCLVGVGLALILGFVILKLIFYLLPGVLGVGGGVYLIVIGHDNWGVIAIILGVVSNLPWWGFWEDKELGRPWR
jgi:hypothetical protein